MWQKIVSKFTRTPPKIDPWTRKQQPVRVPKAGLTEKYPNLFVFLIVGTGLCAIYSKFLYDVFIRKPPENVAPEVLSEPIDWSAFTFGKLPPEKRENYRQRYEQRVAATREQSSKGLVRFVSKED